MKHFLAALLLLAACSTANATALKDMHNSAAPTTGGGGGGGGTTLLQPSDLNVAGAWKFDGDTCLTLGGGSLSYNAAGNSGSGSLIVTGGANCKAIGEYTIPVAVATTDPAAMNAATQLQAFATPNNAQCAAVQDNQAEIDAHVLSSTLVVSVCWPSYNVSGIDYDSVTVSNLTTLNSPSPHGLYHVGPYHIMGTSQNIFDLDATWVAANVPNKSIGFGRTREAGCCGSSPGPSIFAAQVPTSSFPSNGTQLSATQLLGGWQYPVGYDKNISPNTEGANSISNYTACDRYGGMAHVLTSGNKTAVLVWVHKGLGPTTYGTNPITFNVHGTVGTITRNGSDNTVRGQTSHATGVLGYTYPGLNATIDTTVVLVDTSGAFQSGETVCLYTGTDDCTKSFVLSDAGTACSGIECNQGYHCAPYERQIWFFDPADLVPGSGAATGGKQPYAIMHAPSGVIAEYQGESTGGGLAYNKAGNKLWAVHVDKAFPGNMPIVYEIDITP